MASSFLLRIDGFVKTAPPIPKNQFTKPTQTTCEGAGAGACVGKETFVQSDTLECISQSDTLVDKNVRCKKQCSMYLRSYSASRQRRCEKSMYQTPPPPGNAILNFRNQVRL